MANVTIIYYSSSGTNHVMAQAVEEGAKSAGAKTRRRLVAETAPDAAIDRNPKWREFVDQTKAEPPASQDDFLWGDAVIFGTPTRFGNVASQLKSFIDTLGGLWAQGKTVNKIYAGFTSAQNQNGGQESTLLALYNTFYHFSGIIVPSGYADSIVMKTGGNPYGPSVTAGAGGPSAEDLEHARFLGRRVAELAAKLSG
ncbi:MAG: NAD(P)H:quinone oxidoreductase [Enhygromyxa sp.]